MTTEEQRAFASAEILNALAHFQEARESGQFCCLGILSDFDFVWGIEWCRYEPGAHDMYTLGHFNSGTLTEVIDEFYTAWKQGWDVLKAASNKQRQRKSRDITKEEEHAEVED